MTALALDDPGKLLEDPVPLLMPVIIVEPLEMIDVQHDDREGLLRPISSADLLVETHLNTRWPRSRGRILPGRCDG